MENNKKIGEYRLTIVKIIEELRKIESEINKFPSETYIRKIGRNDLRYAIEQNGGINRFRELMGYKPYIFKPWGYWTEENTKIELIKVINNIGHFPSETEIRKLDIKGISTAISKHGGLNRFRELLGYDHLHVPVGYWTDDIIIVELTSIIKKIGHFPTISELQKNYKQGLITAINNNGGINRFRLILGYDIPRKPIGYWNDETILKELKDLESIMGYLPTRKELEELDRHDLVTAIQLHGGYPKFRNLLGSPVSIQEKYKSELGIYSNKRGKNSEKIINKILIDYCNLHNLPSPSYNVKLSKGNVIEFVCNTGKRIGIDVTNTSHNESVYRKWTKKDYYKHLDELWIVVVSDSFSSQDYHKWNQDSPDNVKVMSIYQFVEELDYSLDKETELKVDNYCKCTFHTKEEFKRNHNHDNKINTYIMLPSTKHNLCII